MTLEQQIAKVLDQPCGHLRSSGGVYGAVTTIGQCSVCLPKRIAAAIEAAAYDSTGGLYDGALSALKGEA